MLILGSKYTKKSGIISTFANKNAILSTKLIRMIKEMWYLCNIIQKKHLKNISMKTIYECSQSKGIKWFTLIF